MKILENIRAVAESAKDSAAVSLNAARDAYVLLEAERKGEDGPLLHEAADQYQAKHGCTAAEAFLQVGKRAEYLKELSIGESTFHTAKQTLEAKSKRGGNESPKPA